MGSRALACTSLRRSLSLSAARRSGETRWACLQRAAVHPVLGGGAAEHKKRVASLDDGRGRRRGEAGAGRAGRHA
eukprot:3580072-Rhodomonas_salina.2